MNKQILIFSGIVLFLALLGYVLYNNLEIYEEKTVSSPSRDVISNNYYAMERWLKETGHPVRFENNFNPSKFAAIEERVVMIHSSVSKWDNAEDLILPWIEQGGHLIISLDINGAPSIDENLIKLIHRFGIVVGYGTPEENNSGELFSDESVSDESASDKSASDKSAPEESIPQLGRNVNFHFLDRDEIFAIKDNSGYVRLVEISIGDGALTLIGWPYFMNNNFLHNEINAELAWRLTGARAEGKNTGVLFVRERNIPKNMFGKIMDRGNLLPVAISAFLLIILGFWMVIPVFGLTAVEKQRTSRPIRERFIAEILFLKKYRALDHYLDVYEREQNPAGVYENKKAYNYRELINQYRRIFNGTAKF
jgi:hypothetical protein